MAILQIINKDRETTKLNSFMGSNPVKTSCFFKESDKIDYRIYYYSGNIEPKIGDSIFYDILGISAYNDIFPYVLFKETDISQFYLKIISGIVVDIIECKKIVFKEFEALEQSEELICTENNIYPDNLTKNSEIFYHTGNLEFPSLKDKVYLEPNLVRTLNNFTGLFNILNQIYYYFKTDNSGNVVDILTCKKNNKLETHSIRLIPVIENTADENTIISCKNYTKETGFNWSSYFYKSNSTGLPSKNKKLYVDKDLTTVASNSIFFISNKKFNNKFIKTDSNGLINYYDCFSNLATNTIVKNNLETNSSYILGSIYNNLGDEINKPFVKIYFDNSIDNNLPLPEIDSIFYKYSNLESPIINSYILLSKQNCIAKYAITNELGEFQGVINYCFEDCKDINIKIDSSEITLSTVLSYKNKPFTINNNQTIITLNF